MTVEADLINEIQGMLGSTLTLPLSTPTAAPDLFEAYILTIVLSLTLSIYRNLSQN
jgi:hypothetical protein